jgi:acid phosphatase family membrane protein YuiD
MGIMSSLALLTSNRLLNLCFIAWASAQLIKTVLEWMGNGSLHMERLVGSGGMPSSHSSMVCALVIGMARLEGFGSPLFAFTMAFAGVVLYDAMGVRRAAGEQAKALNRMMFNFNDIVQIFSSHQESLREESSTDDREELQKRSSAIQDVSQEKTLKEYIGHTPMEVLAGALLGILIAMLYPVR